MSRVVDLAGRGVLHRRGRIPLTLAVLGWLAVSGCGSDDLPAPNPVVGSLLVTITSPSPLPVVVTVKGPGGYEQALADSPQALTGLQPGIYTVTAASFAELHPVVGTARYDPDVRNLTVTVIAGATTSVTVNYTPQPGGTGAMWVANADHASVVSFSADRLLASTEAAPTTVISTGAGEYGAAFDAERHLWLSLTASDQLVKYTASQLTAGGAPTPAVVLSTNGGSIGPGVAASLVEPAGLAFDDEGNLWVANSDNNTVVTFAPGQLESSGSPTPLITLSSNSGSLDQPTGLAFGHGGLWVANRNNNTVVAFSTAQRAVSGAPVPAVTLQSSALASPFALAFDDLQDDFIDGDESSLWVSNFSSNTVVKFAANQLRTGGAVSPARTLSPVGASLSAPAGLAFDQSYALWVANQSGNTVVRFTLSQLLSGGAQTPEVIVSGVAVAGPASLAFSPTTVPPSCNDIDC
jgi:sugar lactone lactonase YvrE